MKISYSLTSLILGLTVATVILVLVRRNHLHVRFAVWWLLVAGASIIFGAFPRLIDRIARIAGVHYPPTLLLVVGLALVLLKMLTMDLERSEQECRLRLLTQRLALFESRFESGQKNPPPYSAKEGGGNAYTSSDEPFIKETPQ